MGLIAILASSVVVLTNMGFTVGYDTVTRQPSWVAYDLEPCEVLRMKRVPHGFHEDKRVPKSGMADFYKVFGSVYDRGHYAPAADFNWNTNALDATYLFTNISPMTPKLNRGAWLDHENEVRRLAESGTVHVVIFPNWEGDDERFRKMELNAPCVLVPGGFTKVAWGWFGVRVWKESNEP